MASYQQTMAADVGRKIQFYRLRKNRSIRRVADDTGLATQTISLFEAGKLDIRVSTLMLLMASLKVTWRMLGAPCKES